MNVIPPIQTRHTNVYKKFSLPFKNDENSQQPAQIRPDYVDTLEKNTRSAKNLSILAAIGSVTTLIVSAVMLKKASEAAEIVKVAKPMIEELKEPAEALRSTVSSAQNFLSRIKSSVIGQMFSQVGSELKNHISDAYKKAIPIIEKLNTEKDPETLDGLNKQLSDIITETLTEIAKNVDAKQVKNIEELIDTPIIKVLESMFDGKFNVSGDNISVIIFKLAEIFKEGKISQSSTIREAIKPILELIAKDEMMKKAALLDRLKIYPDIKSDQLADLEKILNENSFKESLLKIKEILGISEKDFQEVFKVK